MPQQDDIPRVCYELLSVIHTHGAPIPFRKLPEKLRNIGLLKVCRHRGLIEVLLWHESDCGSGGALPPNAVIVVPLPGWVPIYNKGYSSIAHAIERDAECDDPKRGLHVGLTGRGDIAFEEWKLAGEKVGSGDTSDGQSSVDDGGMPEQLLSLKPSLRRAFLQREYAQKRCPRIEPGQPSDNSAHNWLVEHGDEEGDRPASRDTWLRYLRAARRRLDENDPRRGRSHGPSIAPSNQI